MYHWRNLSLAGALRVLAVVAFLGLYSIVTLHLVEMQQKQNCPSVDDIVNQVRTIEEQEHAKGLQMLNLTLKEIVATREGKGVEGKITAPLGKAIELPTAKPDGQVKKEERNKPSMYVGDGMPVNSLLNQNYTPTFVFYVWCGSRWFEFVHYLSVLSVARHLRPDNVIVYYDIMPVVDSWTYNTWFNELFEKFPFFHGYKLSATDYGCSRLGQANLTFITELLKRTGGMYVNESTILNSFPVHFRLEDMILGENDDGSVALLMAKKSYPSRGGLWASLQDRSVKSTRFPCVTRSLFIQQSETNAARCVHYQPPLFPKDIWELEDAFGRLVRTVFYGGPDILRATPSYDTLIPNIAHIVWLGGGYMDFLFYLNVLSLIYVAKVDMVYIHGDGPPTGWYWELLKKNNRLQLIYRESPGLVYGTAVNVVSHVTDIWRVDFMIKYGGIYVDTDVVFVRPLDYEIRGYDAVGTYDWTYWNHPYPDTINFGVAIGKRNAPYWHKFQESMKWFMDGDWSWNGLRQPYRIQERQPDLVKIDPRLQVTCFRSKCHPTWWPDYHNESVHHLNSPSIKDWRKDIYAFHWTLPTPYELLNHTNLLTTNTMFSEIGQHVLQQAGMMDFFTRIVQREKGTKHS